MTPVGQTRLPAAERRQAIVEAALTVFSTGSYSGATTAQIAKEAGISEPILYRHFSSKRDLYFACLDEAWERLQAVFVEKLEGAGGASSAPGDFALRVRRNVRVLPPTLWMQALTEAGQDPAVASYLRRHMRDVHDFVAGSIRRSQANGWIDRDRDADAEAWIFLGGMLLLAVADRLGDVLSADDFAAIAAQRVKWLSGNGEQTVATEPGSEATLQGSSRDSDCAPVKKMKRPRLRLRGRFFRQAATGRLSERRDPAARSRPCGCGGRTFGGAPLHTSLASAGASWQHCTSTVRKSQVARSSDLL